MSERKFPDRFTIEAGQLAALGRMVETLIPDNKFYTPRFVAAGLSEGIGSLEDFFARMPFTTKQEVMDDQRSNPPYGTNLTFPVGRYTRFSQTSGTTGSPLRWLDTTESWGWMVANWEQVLQSSGVGPEDRIFFAFSFGPFLGFWTAFEAGVRQGCLCIPGGGMSSEARLRAIRDNDVTVLCCTPTYAMRLGEVAEEAGISLADTTVRAILVAGEPGAGIPATRARIERLWGGARVWDHHGMTETGPVTFECPARRGVLHVIENYLRPWPITPRPGEHWSGVIDAIENGYIAEVIDPKAGTAVGPGESGELVLTNLGRVGSPLIRYRTGDLVKRAPETPCACGRYNLALEGGILGRTDDMVVIRGVNLHPTAVEQIIRGFEEVAEYRIEICATQALPEITVQIESVPDCIDTTLCPKIETALRATFNLRVPVHPVPSGTLPRFELKAKRWIRRER